MKKILVVSALVALFAIPLFADEETWKNVSLIDTMCLKKVTENPDSHTTKCLVQCSKGGYGILTADGAFLKLDEAGNEKALAVIKATDQKDHVRVTVVGQKANDTVQVTSISLEAGEQKSQ